MRLRFAIGVVLTALLVLVQIAATDAQPKHKQSARCGHRCHSAPTRRHHRRHHHHRRRAHLAIPATERAEASWFDDAGSTACPADGIGETLHVWNGFAHRPAPGWPCGTKVMFCYYARCVVGVMEDHGPYIDGRLFDLTAGLKDALGCPDLCKLHWRRL